MKQKLVKFFLLTFSMSAVLTSAACSSFDKKARNEEKNKQSQLFQKKELVDKRWKKLFDDIKSSKDKFFFINEKIQKYWQLISNIQNKDNIESPLPLPNESNTSILGNNSLNSSNDLTRNSVNLGPEILKKYFDEQQKDSLFNYSQKASVLSLDIDAQFSLHSVQLERPTSNINIFLDSLKNIKKDQVLSVDQRDNLKNKISNSKGQAKEEIIRAILDPKLSRLTPEQYSLLNKIVNPDSTHSFFHSHALINIMNELIMLIDNSFDKKFINDLKNFKKELKVNDVVSSSDLEDIDAIINLVDKDEIIPIWLNLSQETNSFVEAFDDITNFISNVL